MRKRLITPTTETVRSRGEGWLDVERAAGVEVTSEDDDSPVESAFVSGELTVRPSAVARGDHRALDVINVTDTTRSSA